MNLMTRVWEAFKCLLTRMMNSEDSSANSIVVCGTAMTGGLVLCALFLLVAGVFGIDIKFSLQDFGIGGGAILAGMASGRAAYTYGKTKAPGAPEPQL